MQKTDHRYRSRRAELWPIKESVRRTDCSLQCPHPGRDKGHPDWTGQGQGLHGLAGVHSVYQTEARGCPVEWGLHRTVPVCKDRVLEKSEISHASQEVATFSSCPAAETHALWPHSWQVGGPQGVHLPWWKEHLPKRCAQLDKEALHLGCLLEAYCFLLCPYGKTWVYLLPLLRATSLGEDSTSREALINWLARNTHENLWTWRRSHGGFGSHGSAVRRSGTWCDPRGAETGAWGVRSTGGPCGLGKGWQRSHLTSVPRALSSGSIDCVSQPLLLVSCK